MGLTVLGTASPPSGSFGGPQSLPEKDETPFLKQGQGWAAGPALPGTGNGPRQEGGKEVGWDTFMCVLGGGGAGRRTGNSLSPLPQLPFPSVSAGHPPPHRQPGGPRFLSHRDGSGRGLEWEGRERRGGGGRPPPHPPGGGGGECTLPQAIPLPSGGKGQRKQILAKVTAGRGLAALGSPSIQGANRLGSGVSETPHLLPESLATESHP